MRGFTGEVPKAQRVLAHGLKKQGVVVEENVQCGGREADIYIPNARLIVEIDGLFHLSTAGRAEDQRKTGIWEEQGFTVIRFTNQEVLRETKRCIEHILRWLTIRHKAINRSTKNNSLGTNNELQALRQDLIKHERRTMNLRRGESIEAFFLRRSGEESNGEKR